MTIYVITHKVSGKSYVGQASDVVKRIGEHVRTAGTSSSLIGRAIHKHGVDAFFVRTADLPEGSTREALNAMEQMVIAHMTSVHPTGYNLSTGGGVNGHHHPDSVEKIRRSKIGRPRDPATNAKISATLMAHHPMRGVPFHEAGKRHLRELFAGKPLSDDHRAKLRAAWARRKDEGWTSPPMSAEARANHSAARIGKPVTLEVRQKISAKLKGRPLSLETRAKMSATRKGRKFSDAHRAALRHPCSEATKAKISAKKRERDAARRREVAA